MFKATCLVPVVSVVLLGLVSAQKELEEEADFQSGPVADSEVGKVMCYANSGPYSGREFDAVAEIGQGPGALLFIHQLSRNTAPVIQEWNRLGEDHALLGYDWFSVILDDDRTNGEQMLKRVNGSLKMANPLVLSLDGLEGPGDFSLNRKATLTLVLVKEGRVTRSIGLTDTGPADFPKLKNWIEEVAGKLPEDEAALRALVEKQLPEDVEKLRRRSVDQTMTIRRLKRQLARARSGGRGGMNQRPNRMNRENRVRPPQQREGGSPPETADRSEEEKKPKREGKPPEDPALNASLRSFIRKTNDEQRCDEVFADIEKRAGESEALKEEAVEMFRLMLSFRDRYGTGHAQQLAESFLKKHATEASE